MFRFATDRAADGVFWVTRDAGFYYVNDEACRSLGYTREELMRLHVFDIVPSFSKEQWEAAWGQLESGQIETQQLETVHRRKDGSLFPSTLLPSTSPRTVLSWVSRLPATSPSASRRRERCRKAKKDSVKWLKISTKLFGWPMYLLNWDSP